MPVNDPNDAYKHSANKVKRVRDCAEGNDAVKSEGELYLPRPDGQTDKQYQAFKTRGFLIPAIKPTASALTGAIMRKDPVAEIPSRLSYLLTDCDGNGRDLSLLAAMSCSELMIAGRYGYLAEVTKSGVAIKSYTRESIINWSSNYIVLKQSYPVFDDKDKFKVESRTEFLELTFDDQGLYIQNVWREGSSKSWGIVDTKEPAVNGTRLDYLPFVFVNTMDATPALTDPVLLHLADVNLDQYRLSTDLRHGLHWTALPTLFLFGDVTDDKGRAKKITVGAGSSNHIQDERARAELLEFSGQGLAAIDNAIKSDVETMAAIGARLLQVPSKGVKAAETAKIEESGSSATLSTIAQSVENGITNVLAILADWSGINEIPTYTLNRDFIDAGITPQEITAYLQALMSNSISLDTFVNLLHKNDILPEGVTVEDEIGKINEGRDFDDGLM